MSSEVPKVSQPQVHTARICIWADLKTTHLDLIMKCTSMEEIQRFLAETFDLTDWQENYRSGILLDLFYYAIQFALDNQFTKEQISAFFSIVKKTHDVCTETPFDNLELCYDYFKELILCHAVKRPPWSINIFSPEQVRLVTDYVLGTYFKHYKLYKYVFTPLVRLDLTISYAGMPVTPEPAEVEEENQETEPETIKEEEQQQPSIQVEEEPSEAVEEDPAQRELRQIITDHLSGEIEKLKQSINEQIQTNDDAIQKKLGAINGKTISDKSGRASSKSKIKK
ncbi:coiled-coil domain-containing protein 189-like [Anneissia japonica]|uniref:coiled-coil domain-containing protein 189-like n=1 Tax=Anneissia japonica TaxID=1529436 RepID=UPI001425B7CC|nr:coiled-coil domain-containing protein 189-like [Anneissia japonica]